ncbi:MAG TPA: type II toxin-antitoxin system RelE/ParE family toxin [Arcobacter sp.]|nr:type II toxin-antitoxin system RelE/ParE family toxin [Arcobacter sp.]
MIITYTPAFLRQLKQIIEHIALDKPTASMKFKDELKKAINLLPDHPLKYRKSIYFDNENMRDMIYKKYTIVYRLKPRKNEIAILRIFNRNKPPL